MGIGGTLLSDGILQTLLRTLCATSALFRNAELCPEVSQTAGSRIDCGLNVFLGYCSTDANIV